MQSGQAVKAVDALVELAVELDITGFIADYEPHANNTSAHARAFAEFLTALAARLHAKHKQLGVCVSDWGVIGPMYYALLSGAKVGQQWQFAPLAAKASQAAMSCLLGCVAWLWGELAIV